MYETPETPAFDTEWRQGAFDGRAAFAGMREAFEAAAAALPAELCESFYRFAGRSVRLRVVGRELHTQIARPFSHLRARPSASRPALQMDLWDATRTRGAASWRPPGRANGWHETTFQSEDARYIAQRLPHTLSCLDRERGELLGGIAWHDDIFIYERAKPFARLLLAWHNNIGVQIVHAGLVSRNGVGVLLAGKSGSGKSTSSLLCALAGLDFVGEDYVALERAGDGSFVGHSLYNSVFLDTRHVERFPQLASLAFRGLRPHEEKSVVLLSDVVPERLERCAQIRALVFPEVTDSAGAEIRALSKGAALLALAPSSLLQIPNRDLGARGFERLADLVQSVPCFRLAVGSDWESITNRLDALARGEEAARAECPDRVA